MAGCSWRNAAAQAPGDQHEHVRFARCRHATPPEKTAWTTVETTFHNRDHAEGSRRATVPWLVSSAVASSCSVVPGAYAQRDGPHVRGAHAAGGLGVLHVMMRHYATRQVVHVNFKTKTAATDLGRFGNHWPSRSGGPSRRIPGRRRETLGYFHQRVLELHGTQTPVGPAGDVVLDSPDTLSVRRPRATAFSSSNRFSTFTTSGRRQQPVNSQSTTTSSCLVRSPSAGDRHRHRHAIRLAADPGLTVVSSWCLRANCRPEGRGCRDGAGLRHAPPLLPLGRTRRPPGPV
jgi:hypothetical protein